MRPSPYLLLPLGILALGLIAAPFYGGAMEKIMWMGQAIKAMCGF